MFFAIVLQNDIMVSKAISIIVFFHIVLCEGKGKITLPYFIFLLNYRREMNKVSFIKEMNVF